MSDNNTPQIYLITPSEADLDLFPDQLAQVLDSVETACVRLALSSSDEDKILRMGDALREVTQSRDVALVIENHTLMVTRLGLDGVHLSDGAKSVRKLRADLGADAIIGAFCGTSRHDGINAAEAGADYVSFGPLGASALGDGSRVDPELFSWWSEVIEVPVVAEGNLDKDLIASYCDKTDFFGIGREIWAADSPVDALRDLLSALR